MLTVKIVQNGTLDITPEGGMIDNRPSCSLIQPRTPDIKRSILIDLDHPAKNRSDLVGSLGAIGVSPNDIGAVILTHLHPDHIGHKDLFPHACFIFHKAEKLAFYFKNNRTLVLGGDMVYHPGGDGRLSPVDAVPDLKNLGDGIYLRHCPGHTRGSVAAFVCADSRISAFAGDIILNKTYYDNWEAPGMSWDQERVYEQMQFIKEHADVIIPGHGVPFET